MTLPAVSGPALSKEVGPNVPAEPWQGGMTNTQLTEAWHKKLPGVVPTHEDLRAFALGIEVGFDHARDLERQDWSRVHHVLAKHGVRPSRNDDHLGDVIDRELMRLRADLKLMTVGHEAALRAVKAVAGAVTAERERCAKVCEAAWEIDGQFSANEFAARVRGA